MYVEALNAIILIGNLKVILTALGWTAVIAAIVFIIIANSIDWIKDNTQLVLNSIGCFLVLITIACGTIYSLPILKQEIVIAKTVAPILDKYTENNPESIYNPDVALDALDQAIKGIVSTSIELPKYIQRLASGQLIPKSIDQMNTTELRARIRELESK